MEYTYWYDCTTVYINISNKDTVNQYYKHDISCIYSTCPAPIYIFSPTRRLQLIDWHFISAPNRIVNKCVLFTTKFIKCLDLFPNLFGNFWNIFLLFKNTLEKSTYCIMVISITTYCCSFKQFPLFFWHDTSTNNTSTRLFIIKLSYAVSMITKYNLTDLCLMISNHRMPVCNLTMC